MKHEDIVRAEEWQSKHLEHVKKLIENPVLPIEPSREDAKHPELWKPGHWMWFVN